MQQIDNCIQNTIKRLQKQQTISYDQWNKLFFNQPVNNDERTHDNITKITDAQGDNYATVNLLHYAYFKEN